MVVNLPTCLRFDVKPSALFISLHFLKKYLELLDRVSVRRSHFFFAFFKSVSDVEPFREPDGFFIVPWSDPYY